MGYVITFFVGFFVGAISIGLIVANNKDKTIAAINAAKKL